MTRYNAVVAPSYRAGKDNPIPGLLEIVAIDQPDAYRQAVAMAIDFSRLTGCEWFVQSCEVAQ